MLLSWYALRGEGAAEALRPPPCTPTRFYFLIDFPCYLLSFVFIHMYSHLFFLILPFRSFLTIFTTMVLICFFLIPRFCFFFDPSILLFFDPYLFFFDPLAGMDNSCLGSSNQHIKDSFMRLHSLDRMFSEVVIWKEVNLYSVVTSVIFPCF